MPECATRPMGVCFADKRFESRKCICCAELFSSETFDLLDHLFAATRQQETAMVKIVVWRAVYSSLKR